MTFKALIVLTGILLCGTWASGQVDYTKEELTLTGNSSTNPIGIKVNNMNGIRFSNFNVAPEELPIGTIEDSAATDFAGGGGMSGTEVTPAEAVTCTYTVYLKGRHPMISGSGNAVYFVTPGSHRFNSLYVSSVYNLSDLRAKTDVRDLGYGLAALRDLRPVSYNWKKSPVSDADTLFTGGTDNRAYGPDSEGEQIGLIAQEVEEVVPQAVQTDESGNKALNYIALIPVLIKSIQELEGQVDVLKEKVAALESQLPEQDGEKDGNQILSCTPNPTKGDLTVRYSLEEGVMSAKIRVSSVNGGSALERNCQSDSDNVQVNLAGFVPGVYVVTLVVDNSPKDSRQIILN